ncbi:ubiquitin carboxyl-terminal hydrolase 47-like isoform X1 [Homalodisca vitripennis]|uniref:ubiquitin carboxyl-terminal hydrolase 47-like isoform X1 n=1 Tax=Homalodisca vitripennis TaxID=197043 RepID=UPI001EEBD945|nr:ubiquitin carboxyl-terminal hydrolase 47-like isoform X1 [Homalodisca vitripennis]
MSCHGVKFLLCTYTTRSRIILLGFGLRINNHGCVDFSPSVGRRMCFQGMVCALGESQALCIVRDLSTNQDGSAPIYECHVPGSTTVRDFVQQVASHFSHEPQNIELILSLPKGEEVKLKESSDETLQSSGVRTDNNSRNSFILQTLKTARARASPRAKELDEELNLGASASPTTAGDYPTYHIPSFLSSQENPPYNTAGLIKQDTGYVGLVNQAMTCYLNSLLQALFMTPEFRNALYKWQYDPQNNSDPAKCIPYQLQRLFLNLQTSSKTAVETTELTRSFGWDSSEAWQQHDIQELCRVMFDALEHVFKNTKQADLIDRLYQGKMIDYVKCLECGKEKSREDTFLDIPLPVRPFGSTVAYGSVEEAVRAFVQPETLDGANQYFCEACSKKCDAHKGLKFTKFPYLLTLHLKRFDFDYNTMHRIKLNDKVTFPKLLDLNSFVEVPENRQGQEEGSEGLPDELTVSKCDDSSTTDSGSALDDESCPGPADINLPPVHDNNQEDDEGIDVSGSGPNQQENEKNRRHGLCKGPYLYELFSIMIHSGSASGGHYYAYIKDFSNGEWFCFNDTSVSRITNDDIMKTYGGGALRGYYSGAYSSSTNAYMLMYRQINDDNCDAIKVQDFPPHIKELYSELKEKQETDRRIKDRHLEMIKLKVYCEHPSKGMTDVKIYVHNDSTFGEVTSRAYETLKLDSIVAPADCRLVSYNPNQESIEVSFDGRETESMSEILVDLKTDDMLLEIKNPDDEFEVYQPGDISVKAYYVDLEKEEVKVPPFLIRSPLSNTVGNLKDIITMNIRANTPSNNMVFVIEKYCYELSILEDDSSSLQQSGFSTSNKMYVSNGPLETPFVNSKLHTLIDRFENVITLHLTLPETDPDTLARMSIPSLSAVQAAATAKQSGDAANPPVEKAATEPAVMSKVCGARGLMLPLILTGAGDEESGGISGGAGGHSDQSTSEDSSLTDSDRTLIGDVQDECVSDGDNQLASPSDEEPNPLPAPEEENWDEPSNQPPPKQFTYFKALPVSGECKKTLTLCIQVDKRMTIETLKSCLEPYVGVPASCFKLYRSGGTGDYETPRTRQCDSLSGLKSDDTLVVRLGRQLTCDEHRIKVYQLVLNSTQPIKYLCEWIIAKGITVGQTKKEIINDLNKKHMNLEYNRCRMRKKNWKNVGRIYLDSQVWVDDVMVYSNGDVFLQELSEPDTVTSTNQLSLFVRHWHPATLTLDPFHEIVLDSYYVDELKEKLSEKSGIAEEYIDFAKPSGFFPCDMSVLNIHSDLEWNPKTTSLDAWPIQINEDGGVLFYKDSREELKTLTQDERNELLTKESARAGAASTISTYSPRKERPLKIYLDRRCCVGEADVD